MTQLTDQSTQNLNFRWMSGGSKPEEIHNFSNFEEMTAHFEETKPLSWGKNFYYISYGGSGLRVSIDEVDTVDDLYKFYQSVNSFIRGSSSISHYSTFSDVKISSDSVSRFSIKNRVKKSLLKRTKTIGLASLGAIAGVYTGGIGIVIMGKGIGISGPLAGALVGSSTGSHLDVK